MGGAGLSDWTGELRSHSSCPSQREEGRRRRRKETEKE
ncbi:hypothetical protein KNP414_02254 [Paenibacillus mucilaginosus KNP414]|uniref:Uncharacterized protein n=1 Tax=Paenibacillus mucilaginosus (strain KNP414) TaxID=1036673 RepID=F8F585_PAEMK|nr:hypothetical protein KNP414_02254 [Paenibacillus mucilaginosus KNP414]